MTIALQKRELPECRACGACCVADEATSSYVDMTEAEVDQLRPKRYKLQVIQHVSGYFSLRTKLHGTETRCVALFGTLGKNVRCDVYEHRPNVCKKFRRGSRACREAIRDAGLR